MLNSFSIVLVEDSQDCDCHKKWEFYLNWLLSFFCQLFILFVIEKCQYFTVCHLKSKLFLDYVQDCPPSKILRNSNISFLFCQIVLDLVYLKCFNNSIEHCNFHRLQLSFIFMFDLIFILYLFMKRITSKTLYSTCKKCNMVM